MADAENKVSVTELARKLMIPKPFLRGIFQELKKADIVRSYKGKAGGFELARKAENIFLTELINLFQGPINLEDCLIKNSICPDTKFCLLKVKIDKIKKYAVTELESITIKLIAKKVKKNGRFSK